MEVVAQDFQEAADCILQAWQKSRRRVLRLEGFMGCGKSGIATLVRTAANVPVLNPDDFPNPYPKSGCISDRIDREQLHASAHKLLKKSPCIFEGVCLEELLPSSTFGGFIVYVKRVALATDGSAVWLDEEKLKATGFSGNSIEEEVRRCHRVYKPHEHADLCLAVPQN